MTGSRGLSVHLKRKQDMQQSSLCHKAHAKGDNQLCEKKITDILQNELFDRLALFFCISVKF